MGSVEQVGDGQRQNVPTGAEQSMQSELTAAEKLGQDKTYVVTFDAERARPTDRHGGDAEKTGSIVRGWWDFGIHHTPREGRVGVRTVCSTATHALENHKHMESMSRLQTTITSQCWFVVPCSSLIRPTVDTQGPCRFVSSRHQCPIAALAQSWPISAMSLSSMLMSYHQVEWLANGLRPSSQEQRQ